MWDVLCALWGEGEHILRKSVRYIAVCRAAVQYLAVHCAVCGVGLVGVRSGGSCCMGLRPAPDPHANTSACADLALGPRAAPPPPRGTAN